MAFIPMAEDTGLIHPLGEWTLREACNQARAWCETFSAHRDMYVSVNICGKQFTPELTDIVGRILRETGLGADRLKLEITESVLIENADRASDILARLRDLGVEVYLDDFGTGYSSLNYLHKFPVAALKIDRSFVTNILTDRTAQEIVRAITSLAANLGMDIIVEGVEGPSELELFRSYNCGHVQGFIFSEPLAVPAFERFMVDFGQQGEAASARCPGHLPHDV
jgi:EAL domain-containing protein (putative c-di-GMP-specific phosphodiesterase class I)